MPRLAAALIATCLLGACAQIPVLDRMRAAPTPEPEVTDEAPAALPEAAQAPVPVPQVAAAPAALDTVSEAEKDAARATAAAAPAGGALGTVTVALGDPVEPGLWVKSALVTAEQPGTVRTGGGEAIAVTLKPLGGAGGPQISLAAMRALGLPLTGLHSVTLAAS
ncbi:hypothetical protein [Jannaschia sp. M317]|uniref:hypothetical protein n=1 Tax=Jannaschia sp. M317 TaxID=2867011 RepID=UPI0021A58A90|nr:hypothetical protein [Jannaschia sp. M317]UWQ16287.1 hypothetical protein K3551_10135 [Jannaschia sp. M317]